MKAEQCQVWRQTGGLRRKTVHFWALHDQKCMGANSMKSVGNPPKWMPFRWKGLQKEKLGQDCEKPNAVKEPAKGLWHSWGFATVAMVIAHAPCKVLRNGKTGKWITRKHLVVFYSFWHRWFVFFRLVGAKVGKLHDPSKDTAFDILISCTDPRSRVNSLNSLRFREIRHVICAKKQIYHNNIPQIQDISCRKSSGNTCILGKTQINANLRDFCFLSGFSPHERNCTTFGSFALCAFWRQNYERIFLDFPRK